MLMLSERDIYIYLSLIVLNMGLVTRGNPTINFLEGERFFCGLVWAPIQPEMLIPFQEITRANLTSIIPISDARH